MLAQPAAQARRRELQLATVIALAEALDIRDTGTAAALAHGRPLRAADGARARLRRGARRARAPGRHPPRRRQDRHLRPRAHEARAARRRRVAARCARTRRSGRASSSRPEFDDLRAWILAHHERPDGKGYPYGLRGDAIPLEARILAVADAYEAMTADRVYRPALGDEAARAELEGGAGTQFDAKVVATFLQRARRGPRAPPAPRRLSRGSQRRLHRGSAPHESSRSLALG